METKAEFHKTICNYYTEISKGKVPKEMLDDVASRIADYYYDQYTSFSIKYPKSIKRYSHYQIKDLEHPDTFEIIIAYFKELLGNDYRSYSLVLLQMTEDELTDFEKNREGFYNMF